MLAEACDTHVCLLNCLCDPFPRKTKQPIGITPFPAINFSLYMTQGGTSLPSSTAVGDAVVTTNKGVYSNPPTGFVTPTVSLPAACTLPFLPPLRPRKVALRPPSTPSRQTLAYQHSNSIAC